MTGAGSRHRPASLMFGGVAAVVYAATLMLAHRLPALDRPDAVATGMTLDLVVVVPLAFYLLVVRRRGWPVVAIAPVLVLSLLAAGRIIPDANQQVLRVMELLAIPAEIGVVSFIAWRATTALRAARRDRAADPLEQLRRAALDLVRQERVAGVLATEIAVFYYGLGAWRARPHAPDGVAAFTHHRRSGHAAIVCALLLVFLIEGVALHLLVAIWSGLAAWLLTISTIYGALWLLADARATALRPLLADEECLVLRAGLRWSLRVPRDVVAGVTRAKPGSGKECLNLTLLGAPTHWIAFSRPLVAEGPYGMRRRVRAAGVQPDAAEAFDRALNPGGSSRQ